jgi:hypothetical protein
LAVHFSFAAEVLDGLIDGLEQLARLCHVLFQHLAMRPERGKLLEFGLAKNPLDLLQLESQFAVEQDLLEHQQLLFFVVAVAVGAAMRGL